MIIDEEDDDSSTRWTEQDTPGDIWNDIDEEQDQKTISQTWAVRCVQSPVSPSSRSVAEEVIIISSDGDFPDLSNVDSK